MTPAERYFLRDLPALIANDVVRYAALRGTLAFSCGAGVKLTVVLGELHAPVVVGFLRSADVRLWFFDDSFAQFLAGDKPSRVKIEGDVEVLERFGRFLQPASTSLSVRFAA